MKYIDADKIRAEIERRKKEHMYDEMPITIGRYYEDRDLLAFIDFDLQEQPEEDLDADIEMEWDSFNKHLVERDDEPEEVVWLDWYDFKDVAYYFYDLGLNARKKN